MFSRILRAGVVLALAIVAMPVVAHAQLTSPSYSLEEVMIGTGGDPELCGDDFCAQQSVGGTGGTASSNNYGIMAGFSSPEEATLSVIVTNNFIDLGVLNTSTTSTGTANFSVSNYLSNGYIVRVNGNPPTNNSGGHALTAMTGASSSSPGTEQFGINLVDNSDPDVGADPEQVPDATFSFGQAETGYDQANFFQFNDGDTIASSDRETGQTNYTMSVMANVSTATPGGRYRTTLVIQVIPAF